MPKDVIPLLKLAALALSPIFICAIYIFIRDKYEKEPVKLLFTGVLYGAFITAPIVHTQNFVTLFIPNAGWLMETFYLTFIVAALVEEGYKFLLLFFLVWRNRNFNERFDGIVYGAFISLGFAGIENVLYVFNPELGGVETGLMRAVFSVPGHAIFGIMMGYYFALMKFEPQRRFRLLLLAYFVPWALHGTFNFILMSSMSYMMVLFVLFTGYLWVVSFRKMKTHIENSPFKPIAPSK